MSKFFPQKRIKKTMITTLAASQGAAMVLVVVSATYFMVSQLRRQISEMMIVRTETAIKLTEIRIDNYQKAAKRFWAAA